MRLPLIALLSPCLLTGLSLGQVAVISGYASDWRLPGAYAIPFVPLVKTPSVSLDNPPAQEPGYAVSPTSTPIVSGYGGASLTPQTVYAVPFVPLIRTPTTPLDNAGGSLPAEPGQPTGPDWQTASQSALNAYGLIQPAGRESADISIPQTNRHINLGAAVFEDSAGVAELAKASRDLPPPAHTYTNQDIDKLNQKTGEVSYGNKTEQLD